MYERLAKPVLFRLDPEDAHHLTLRGLEWASHLPLPNLGPADPALQQTLLGSTYASPIGLAAGLDKNAVAVPAFSAMGFGFVEVGTLTPRAQPGNDRPRLFRLPSDDALINRMGFNNDGVDAAAQRLARLRVRRAPVWANVGRNKTTPNETAAQDYRAGVRALWDVADAFVVNVSSPNTPGLRALQHGDDLRALLTEVMHEAEMQRVRTALRRPVLVKLAPDLTGEELEVSVEAALTAGIEGLILTNTTLSREGLTHAHREQTGGLSGRPLTARSTQLVRDAYRLTRGRVPIVGVGGVFTAQDALDKITAGANLVELYTALIYRGPGVVRALNAGLTRRLRERGFRNVAEAIGTDA
ncbi:quinone-dependent dihydroorotate dehydrogenase [Deinococcus maricopensis]|uniref:quinone-dependent dihydroorotate dehydrogenase n=1 Tax=Deinococcus maricopensis TaxID=309887 RepID=UPI0011D25981|nr:quinone-dependent dihydroorotate dehydrogenase [Deinococcus maricopensis]